MIFSYIIIIYLTIFSYIMLYRNFDFRFHLKKHYKLSSLPLCKIHINTINLFSFLDGLHTSLAILTPYVYKRSVHFIFGDTVLLTIVGEYNLEQRFQNVTKITVILLHLSSIYYALKDFMNFIQLPTCTDSSVAVNAAFVRLPSRMLLSIPQNELAQQFHHCQPCHSSKSSLNYSRSYSLMVRASQGGKRCFFLSLTSMVGFRSYTLQTNR